MQATFTCLWYQGSSYLNLLADIDVEKSCFLMKNEISLSAIFDFSQSHEHIFLKVIKLPFRRGVNFNRFLIKEIF